MYIVIFVTTPNKKEANHIAEELIKNKLAACINIIGNIESTFWWQAKIEREKEVLLIVKSKKSKLTKIIKLVKSLHSYKVPEVIALPIVGGEKKYLRWIDESLWSDISEVRYEKNKILLIDDDKQVLKSLDNLLEKEGYDVTAIDDSSKAIETAQKK